VGADGVRVRIQARCGDQCVRQDRTGRGAARHPRAAIPVQVGQVPVNNIEIDVEKSAPAVERALAAFQQDITLFENDRPLVASHATGRLSLPSDRSFESYDQAVTHVAEPLEHGISIYIDQGYVDARITYPISSPDSVFSIRTTAGRELGDYLKLAAYSPKTLPVRRCQAKQWQMEMRTASPTI